MAQNTKINDQQAAQVLLSYKGQIAAGGSRAEFQHALDQLVRSASKREAPSLSTTRKVDPTKPGLLSLLSRAETLLRENATTVFESYSIQGVADFEGEPDAKAWYDDNIEAAADLAAMIDVLANPSPATLGRNPSSLHDGGVNEDRT